MILLGVDTGGTFTDFVCWQDKKLSVHKVPSTPNAPEQAIWQGVVDLNLEARVKAGDVLLIHGTTVGTNAALENKGVKTAFITNRGFADMLTLGRQARRHLFRLQGEQNTVPVPEEYCWEIDCRRDSQGKVVKAIDQRELDLLCEQIKKSDADAIAINLLFSYLNPSDEIEIAKALPNDRFICRSSDVLPEYKEYERGIATWLNAYLGPIMQRYLQKLITLVTPSKLTVMQSSGGTIAAAHASTKAVNLLLSGPAGGLAAVKYLSNAANLGGLMTFDMGGTSTDVALVDGDLSITNEGSIGPYPVAVPMVDMHTIGAGGGSIAYIDKGGLLQVGPESAGANPGPACYDRGGTKATVTDANFLLGRLPENNALGGSLKLNRQQAESAIKNLADTLQLTLQETAQGILNIANEHMARALRVISVQRGYDPKTFRLCSFGGAGGLHVCELAELLGMHKAVVPIHNGVLSAFGLLVAPPERQMSLGVQRTINQLASGWLEQEFSKLQQQATDELIIEGIAIEAIQINMQIDLRYLGQSSHLTIPFKSIEQCQTLFQQRHLELFGHDFNLDIEVVTLRLRAYADAKSIALPSIQNTHIDHCVNEKAGSVYKRDQLPVGTFLHGPALIVESTATTYLAVGWSLEVDSFGNLLLEKRA